MLARLPLLKFLDINQWRMRPKMMLAFLAVGLIPLLLLTYISTTLTRDALLNQGATNLASSSTSTTIVLDQYLNGKREDIAAIGKLSDIVLFTSNPRDSLAISNAQSALQAMASKTDIESVDIINMEGTILLSSAPSEVGSKSSTSSYFREAARGLNYISDPSVSPTINRPVIFFSAPIRGASAGVIGVVRSQVNLYGLWTLVEKDKDIAGPGTYGVLLDENGIRLATSLSLGNREYVAETLLFTAVMPVAPETEKQIISEGRLGKSAQSTIRVLPVPEVANGLSTPGIKSFETSSENSRERHYAAIASMTAKPWSYVLMTPLSTFTSTANQLGTVAFLITIIVGGITLLCAYLIARNLTTPLVQLTDVADRISLGELDAAIRIQRKDEIGDLAEAVGRMQTSLQAAIERLRTRRGGS